MIKSPCIRQCCLNDNDICSGCFRHIEEIKDWQQLEPEQQKAILRCCELRKTQKDNQEKQNSN